MSATVVCPLCEQAQEPADACLVCGRPLLAAGAPRSPVAPVEGLEPTRLEPSPEVAVERLPELEPTRFEAPPSPPEPAGGLGWIEQTVSVRVGEVEVEALEVERIEHETLPGRDPFAAVLCRYCARAAAPGDVFCEGCGMKLAVSRPA
jgi:hypothetical protein